MPNVFLDCISSKPEVGERYDATIRRTMSLSKMSPYLTSAIRAELEGKDAGGKGFAIWGTVAGPGNRSRFKTIAQGDTLLLVKEKVIVFIGDIVATTESVELGSRFWNLSITDRKSRFIYFIANPSELRVPFAEFCRLIGYSPNYKLHGFASVSPDRIEAFAKDYGDLRGVLLSFSGASV